MSPQKSRPPGQPPHRDVVALQQELGAAVTRATAAHDGAAVLAAFAQPRTDDAEGLTGLLAELGVASPQAFTELVSLVALSSGYAALSWARGLTTAAGQQFGPDDVRGAAWAQAAWQDADGTGDG